MTTTTYPCETNPLPAGWHDIRRTTVVDWADPRLARITRFRLLTDPGFPLWDVSYCHGELTDGTPVTVTLPFDQLPRRTWKTALVDAARRAGVNARRLGMFDAVSLLW